MRLVESGQGLRQAPVGVSASRMFGRHSSANGNMTDVVGPNDERPAALPAVDASRDDRNPSTPLAGASTESDIA